MKKILKPYLVVFFVTALICSGSHAVFIETLDEFVKRMTLDKEKQEGFKAYYSNFLDRQSKMSVKRKRQKLLQLRADGLSSIEIKDKKTYKKLVEHGEIDLDGQSRPTRLFLVRYRL